VGDLWMLVGILAGGILWQGVRPVAIAVQSARHGFVHVPALVIGAVSLWVGGMLAFLAGALARDPPRFPDRALLIGWTAVIFGTVAVVVASRRGDAEAALPERERRAIGGRYIALGALAAAAVLGLWAYL